MSLALLFARLLLTVIFVVSGVAKLADLAGSRQALRDFGVPASFARPLGVLLPLVELVIAGALLVPVLAWWAAIGAFVLFSSFALGIGYNLARGRTPDCHCFGQLHTTPVGWPTLIRDLVLVAIAAFIVGFGRATTSLNPFGWLRFLTVFQRVELLVGLILLGLLALMIWVVIQIMHQQGRMLVRLDAMEGQLAAAGLVHASETDGLAVGTPAPTFRLPVLTADGQGEEVIALEDLRAREKPVLLIFSDPGCGPCQELLPEVARWQHDYADTLTTVVVSAGTIEANREKVREHGMSVVLLQQQAEVLNAYKVAGTPGAVLVYPNGTIGSALAQGKAAISDLVAQVVSKPSLRMMPLAVFPGRNGNSIVPTNQQPPNPVIGKAAPVFALPDLRGRMISLADFRGAKTLVLFWKPDCGFCQNMLADLKDWEVHPPQFAPRLLLVSTGSVDANQALGLRSPIVLDDGFRVGSLFGAQGTPMAVLVDANGAIASHLAEGASEVLALAGVSQKQ
ncbi:MAG TPA: MauE/DoxX family redox-associated membrane protein [Dictyobacter sp.]|jgi:peroxiredoxin|nr:MauE/DoxX family redox-associated membrane protein [Dictyobacter sp.]